VNAGDCLKKDGFHESDNFNRIKNDNTKLLKINRL